MSDRHAAPGGRAAAAAAAGDRHGADISSVLVWVAAIGAALSVAASLLLSPYAVQVVGEGSVGALRFGGRVLDETKAPGFHFVLPFLYKLTEVPVNVRTTEIRDVECGTSGGVLVRLPSVEIVHRLHPQSVVSMLRTCEDYEKTWIVEHVRHSVNQICARHSLHEIHIDKFDQLDDMIVADLKGFVSEWVPGLQIIAARVSKPTLPSQLQGDFVRVEEEISKLKIAQQHEHLVVRNAETERSKQIMSAEKNRDIGDMTMARELEEKDADLHIQRIEDEMYVARRKDHADAASYSRLREAEANEHRLTPAFLELERRKALYENLEVYFGDRMPEYIRDKERRGRGSNALWRGPGRDGASAVERGTMI